MNYRRCKLSLFLILFTALRLSAGQETPNIVIILADDLGYGSANCYGAGVEHIRTPNIDRLAEEGIKFLDANTPGSVCSPTRYALLTGRYAWRGRLQYGVLDPPEGPLLIEPELLTLPKYLQEHGYQTAHVGKWHLGYTNLDNVEDLSAQPLVPGPRSLGFDYHFAVPNNIDWLPKVYIENESIWGLRSVGKHPYGKSSYKAQQYHGYDAPQRITTKVSQDLADAARNWILKTVRQKPNKPFFLYFAQVAVHNPISPSEKWRGSSGAGPYGDYIHDVDHSVGEVLDALAYSGVLDNTLVIFTSDNGSEKGGRDSVGPLRGKKARIYEGGHRVPFIALWKKGGIGDGNPNTPGQSSDQVFGLNDMFATFAALTGQSMAPFGKWAQDSENVLDVLLGKNKKRPPLVMHDDYSSGPALALRDGPWKLIISGDLVRGNELKPVALFNLQKNRMERPAGNLIKDPEQSARVKRMAT
ncbi:MAG: arylsulfatase, partial [Planctomycetes bacterium]|nr:arylsulfatase [Planctomycetota bacterium]